jgi:hypothetical protein
MMFLLQQEMQVYLRDNSKLTIHGENAHILGKCLTVAYHRARMVWHSRALQFAVTATETELSSSKISLSGYEKTDSYTFFLM